MNPNVFWDIYQQGQISSARTQAESASDKAESLRYDVQRLQRQTEALALACQALWEILREQSDLTDEMVFEKMEEIDLRDGRKDKRMAGQVVVCPSCRRNSNSKRSECLYCGAKLPVKHLFESS